MKWIVFTGFFVLLGRIEGSVLRCSPEGNDAPCLSEEEKVPQIEGLQDPELECLAGSEWESNCHYCRCSDAGTAVCHQAPSCDDAFSVTRQAEQPRPVGKECAVGSAWKTRCQSCVCSETGYPACNLTACNGVPEAEHRCAPLSVWSDECNSCWCSPYGFATCTKIGCDRFGLDTEKDTDSKIEEALPAETLPILKAAAKSNQTCKAKAMFIKDCNICWCNDDGTDFFCTRKVCIPDQPEELEEPVDAPEEFRIIKRECRPYEVFELDCNMCRCNPDGKSFSCTRRACLDLEDKVVGGSEDAKVTLSRKVRHSPQDLPKACQPGQEFRLDCNKCLCDNEGLSFSCTRIDCAAQNSAQSSANARAKREVTSDLVEVATQCTPEAEFQAECNTCRCSKDGKSAQCTREQCAPNNLDSTLREPEPDPGFRCNPGEQFKKDCNDCTCSADGRSTFCTLRFCDDSLPHSLLP